LYSFPYLKQVENIADLEYQQPPPRLLRTRTHPAAGASLTNYIADPRACDTQGCLETNLQNSPYYPFVTCKEYNHVQCGIEKKGMKMYYDNTLREETPLCVLETSKTGMASRTFRLACQVIRLPGSGNYTLLRI